MNHDDLDSLLEAAEAAARAGGEVVAASFGQAPTARLKAPGDWVSDADLASERAIRDVLAHETGDVPFLGEEEGGTRSDRLGWLVDPLDGTANFVHGLPVVGVSVALVRDGVPAVGVVHAPMLGSTYRARLGGGATCDGVELRVAGRPSPQAICATGFPFRRPELRPRYLPVLEHALAGFEDLRRAGAASLDLAWTASGVFDGYFELSLGPWDVAAGALLVREAGGIVSDWSGDPSAWLRSGDIVAGSPAVHRRLLELTASA